MKKKTQNKVLIDYFPPYGEPEISIKGSIAQGAGIIIAIAVAIRILMPAL